MTKPKVTSPADLWREGSSLSACIYGSRCELNVLMPAPSRQKNSREHGCEACLVPVSRQGSRVGRGLVKGRLNTSQVTSENRTREIVPTCQRGLVSRRW